MTFEVIQGHSASCTIFDILTLICQNIKTSRDFDHAHLEDNLSTQD